MTNARAVASRNAPTADQAALAAFMLDGHYDRHLRRSRVAYEERYAAMRRAFTKELGGVVSLAPARGGTHVIGWLTQRVGRRRRESDAVLASRAAAEAGIVAFPLSRYCVGPAKQDGLVLGYGALSAARIASGTARLARVIRRLHTD